MPSCCVGRSLTRVDLFPGLTRCSPWALKSEEAAYQIHRYLPMQVLTSPVPFVLVESVFVRI